MNLINVGCVHGRFQPFHNGHLDYLMSAFGRCQFLHIGITQFTRIFIDDRGMPRNLSSSNPLTYWQRVEIIRSSLEAEGVSRDRFAFTPFPIETPSLLPEFISREIVCYTTIVSEWNNEKIQTLEDQGYTVEVLPTSVADGVRVTTGTSIREMFRSGRADWRSFVPTGARSKISEYMA